MSGSTGWFGWAAGLKSLWAAPPAPGSHEAALEEARLGAVLRRELRKAPGERDEELVHTLRVDYRKRQLENKQFQAEAFARLASAHEQPGARQCCAATGWARQRLAASNRALHAYFCQLIQQVTEELAAAEARRPAALLVQPTLRLVLPKALQQPPDRLDMCSACAEKIRKAELRELQYAAQAQSLQEQLQARGLQPPPAADAPSAGAAAAAAAATALPAGASQEGRQQQEKHGGSIVSSCGKEDAPATPTQQQQQQQQQEHASVDQEQTQQEGDAG